MIDNVTDAKYYSQKDAKAFAVANAPKAASLKSFAEEFFPSFIEIYPSDILEETLDKIVAEAGHIKGVDEVSYGKEYMVKFIAIGRGAWLFITAMSVLFAFSAVFVVYNTVKLSYIRSLVIFAAAFIPFNSRILVQAGINIYNIPDMKYFILSCITVCIICVLSAKASVVSFLKQVSSINEN